MGSLLPGETSRDGLASGVISMFYFWNTPKDLALWQIFVFGAAAAGIFSKGVTVASTSKRNKKEAHLGSLPDLRDPSLSFFECVRIGFALYYFP